MWSAFNSPATKQQPLTGVSGISVAMAKRLNSMCGSNGGIDAQMESRTVHAIMIQLKSERERSVIIWLKDTRKLCVRLMNPRRTWTTARAGDAVTLTHNGTTNREHIESVELYRVFPASYNGQTVECAWTWIDSGAVMRRTQALG